MRRRAATDGAAAVLLSDAVSAGAFDRCATPARRVFFSPVDLPCAAATDRTRQFTPGISRALHRSQQRTDVSSDSQTPGSSAPDSESGAVVLVTAMLALLSIAAPAQKPQTTPQINAVACLRCLPHTTHIPTLCRVASALSLAPYSEHSAGASATATACAAFHRCDTVCCATASDALLGLALVAAASSLRVAAALNI